MRMKWLVPAMLLALGGCVSVSELEQSRETLDVISGKTPRQYADCVKSKLADSRDPLVEEARGDGLRLIVPQKCRQASVLLPWWTSTNVAVAAASNFTSG